MTLNNIPNAARNWMRQAIDLALENVRSEGGGPFGALVVKDGRLIATGVNVVTNSNDPTAHAEVTAIRNACRALGSFQLSGCEIFTSCEPCPMCLGAIYWARPERFYFACSREDAAAYGFEDAFIYEELQRQPEERAINGQRLTSEERLLPFEQWKRSQAKVPY
ncbi:MAG TPA: nucleoside deaminase [Bryobacteraceae bacterium]